MKTLNISFSVSHQNIIRLDHERLKSKSRNYVYAEFTFTEEWLDVDKTAVFKTNGLVLHVDIVDNKCLVPWEMLAEKGEFAVSVFGGDLITTESVIVPVGLSGYEDGGEPQDPTPTIYEQILKKIEEIEHGSVDPSVVQEVVDEYLSDKSYIEETDLDGITVFKGEDGKIHAVGGSNLVGDKTSISINDDVISVNPTYVENKVNTYVNEHKDELKGKDGYTPIKGVDYFDGEDGYTPQKNVDYFDGKDGKDGKSGVWTGDDEPENPEDYPIWMPKGETESFEDAVCKVLDNHKAEFVTLAELEERVREIVAQILGNDDVIITYTFDNDIAGNGAGIITLVTSKADASGTYKLMWGNADGIMDNYSAINTETLVLSETQSVQYAHLISVNAIPKYATKVLAVKNGEIKGTFTIPTNKRFSSGNYGEHTYSFGALADVHLPSVSTERPLSYATFETAIDDFTSALTYLNTKENVDLTCISGDLTCTSTQAQCETYKECVETYSANTPVYACLGNHDSGYNHYMKDNFPTYNGGNDKWFSKEVNGDLFVFVSCNESGTLFETDELIWLEDILEENRNKRVFVFEHVPPKYTRCDGFSNPNGVYNYDIWGSTPSIDKIYFERMLDRYKNAIVFFGHTHIAYYMQEKGHNCNYYRWNNGAKLLHCSSVSVPRDDSLNSVRTELEGKAEGYVIDVYPNTIIVRAREFAEQKFLGLAQYLIDTTIEHMAERTEYIVPREEPTTPTEIPLEWVVGEEIVYREPTYTVIPNERMAHSQAISVTENEKYIINVNKAQIRAVYYDKDDNTLGYTDTTNVDNIVVVNITIPSGAKKMYLRATNTTIAPTQQVTLFKDEPIQSNFAFNEFFSGKKINYIIGNELSINDDTKYNYFVGDTKGENITFLAKITDITVKYGASAQMRIITTNENNIITQATDYIRFDTDSNGTSLTLTTTSQDAKIYLRISTSNSIDIADSVSQYVEFYANNERVSLTEFKQ